MRGLLIGLSTAALIAATPALAQTTQDPVKPKSDTEVNRSAGGKTTASPKATDDKRAVGKTTTKTESTVGEMYRASKLIGASVMNTQNKAVGDINDLIIDSEGKVAEVIVGVGGFLGLGERNVAMKMSEIDLGVDKSGSVVAHTAMTKAQLEQLPAWNKAQAK
jgi:sporulation protein YlmC with PRC-barrel domain